MPEPDSIEEFAGDRAGGAALRRSLEVIAQQYAGHPLGEQVAEVLAGRLDMRTLAGDPEFATLAHDGMRRFAEEWERLDPEQRADLLEQGRRAEAAITAELDAPQPPS